MDSREMRERTLKFAIRVVRLAAALPRDFAGQELGRQILKSGTSIGANYREALRASSRRHFTTTMEIALREADETLYWIEVISGAEILPAGRLGDIWQECDEIVAILAATIRSTKEKSKGQRKRTSDVRANDPPSDQSEI